MTKLGCFLTFVLAAGLVAVNALPVNAAVDALLSSTSAAPGQTLTLTTNDHGNVDAYGSLTLGAYQVVLITVDDPTACARPDAKPLGLMVWTGDVGTLTFTVPSIEPGHYLLALDVEGQCWRIGGSAGVLAIDIVASHDLGPTTVDTFVVMGIGGALALLGLAVFLLWRSHVPRRARHGAQRRF